MPDVLLDGLPVIDLLEITHSTSAVAEITRRDQSSVSRIYRQASERLGLSFHKQPDGRYGASSNQVLLECLRRSSQWLRLNQVPAEPRWLATGQVSLSSTDLPSDGPRAQPVLEANSQQLLGLGMDDCARLVKERLLDLVVSSTASAEAAEGCNQPVSSPAPLAGDDLCCIPLMGSGRSSDWILVRSDLQEQPTLHGLIRALQAAAQRRSSARADLEWLA